MYLKWHVTLQKCIQATHLVLQIRKNIDALKVHLVLLREVQLGHGSHQKPYPNLMVLHAHGPVVCLLNHMLKATLIFIGGLHRLCIAMFYYMEIPKGRIVKMFIHS